MTQRIKTGESAYFQRTVPHTHGLDEDGARVIGPLESFAIDSGQKLCLDGSLTGDTYINESTANAMSFYVGGTHQLRMEPGFNKFLAGNLSIEATNQLYLDGGGDTYITEGTANKMSFYVGGTHQLRIESGISKFLAGNLSIEATNQLYLDGGGDTYLYENSANNVYLTVGGVLGWACDTNGFSVNPTKKIFLDGGNDTFIQENAPNSIYIVANNIAALSLFGGSNVANTYCAISSTSRFYLDGGSDTYITESAANDISIYRGGVHQFRMTAGLNNFLAGNVTIEATNQLYLDGGSDTYLYESSANNIRFVCGSGQVLDLSPTAADFSVGVGFQNLSSSTAPNGNRAYRQSLVKAYARVAPVVASFEFIGHTHNCDVVNSGYVATGHFNLYFLLPFSSVGNYVANTHNNNVNISGITATTINAGQESAIDVRFIVTPLDGLGYGNEATSYVRIHTTTTTFGSVGDAQHEFSVSIFGELS